MTLKFYNFAKQTNSTKKLTSTEESSLALTLTGNFVVESSLQKPIVIVSNTNALALNSKNYFSITFDNAPTTRYYFIREVTALPNGCVKVEGIEDVFATFSTNMANANLHVVASDSRKLINDANNATNPTPAVQLPLPNVLIKYKKHYQISTHPFSNNNGMFIVGIAMQELDANDQPVASRPHAAVNMSGIGYYLFSYNGFIAVMSRLQEMQAEDSDFNLKDKVTTIKYLPIDMTNIIHDSTVPDNLKFQLGMYQGQWQTMSVPQLSGTYPIYKTPSALGNAISKSNIKFTITLPTITEADTKVGGLTTDMVDSPIYSREPYAKMQLLMGPFGVVDISPSEWLTGNIADVADNPGTYSITVSHLAEISVDLATGAAKLRIKTVSTYNTTPAVAIEDIIAENNIQLCPSIPYYGLDSISATSLTQIEHKAALGIVGGIAATAVGVATANPLAIAGGIATAVGSGVSTADAINKEMVQSGYAVGTSSGSFLDFDGMTGRFEIIVYKQFIQPGYLSSDKLVRECNAVDTLSNIPTGSFIICDQVELVSTSGMNYEEQAKVKDLLRSGVFVE